MIRRAVQSTFAPFTSLLHDPVTSWTEGAVGSTAGESCC